jgi:uncharacterized iron-regulated membrane protein
MTLLRKFLLLSHRYLGIAVSLLIVMWFVSGIVMIYAGGMPRLSPEMRLERMAPVDLTRVRLTPAEAEQTALESGASGRGALVTLLGRPAYRFVGATIFADNGEPIHQVTAAQARTIVSGFLGVPEAKVQHVATLEDVDQWTLVQSAQLPLYRFAADDGQGSQIYVQQSSGEVVGHTTSKNRMLSWIGVIPHFFYFTPLRTNQPLWFRIVVWSAGAACALAFLGLVLGMTLFRRPKPFKVAAAIPYKGWMRWHYITGIVFGLFTVTWAFSGLLSMEPFEWTRTEGVTVPRRAFTGGPVDLAAFGAMDPAKWNPILAGRALKEVNYIRINGKHYYDVHATAGSAEEKRRERLHQPYYITGREEDTRVLVSADTLEVHRDPIPVETLVAKLAEAVPEAPIVQHALLTDYDSYYYSRGRLTPLPVLRVKFGDPAETWVYIDPEMGQVLSEIPRLARVERWLYNGLHSLDFSFWYNRRPLWDIGMLTLLTGGLMSSVIGVYFGFKRMKRGVSRVVAR